MNMFMDTLEWVRLLHSLLLCHIDLIQDALRQGHVHTDRDIVTSLIIVQRTQIILEILSNLRLIMGQQQQMTHSVLVLIHSIRCMNLLITILGTLLSLKLQMNGE